MTQDLTGQKFNMLTVLRLDHIQDRKDNNRNSSGKLYHWLCQCDCGNTTVVETHNLTSGGTKSCGCLQRKKAIDRAKELIGKKFNMLTVLDIDHLDPESTDSLVYYKCQCDCGNITVVGKHALPKTMSCGCITRIRARERARQMIGKKVNRLTILDIDHESMDDHYIPYFKCQCDCGRITIVRGPTIITKSCGHCIHENNADRLIKYHTTHNLSHTKIYYTYIAMIDRCYDPTNIHYNNYGGRGITVCKEWYDPDDLNVHSYKRFTVNSDKLKAFIEWAYTEGGYYDQPEDTPRNERLTIERIDVNGPYAPWNCTFIPSYEQGNNKRNTQRILDPKLNKLVTFAQFERNYNLYQKYIGTRYHNSHWSLNAVIHSALHQDLGMMRFNKNNSQVKHLRMYAGTSDDIYVDKDGFFVMIPKYYEKFVEKTS